MDKATKDWDHNCIGNGCRFAGCTNQIGALVEFRPADRGPWCRVCGWRKWGVDSWDGKHCKCDVTPGMRR